jgi:hypothetical protein
MPSQPLSADRTGVGRHSIRRIDLAVCAIMAHSVAATVEPGLQRSHLERVLAGLWPVGLAGGGVVQLGSLGKRSRKVNRARFAGPP